jgi:hypothetical protein
MSYLYRLTKAIKYKQRKQKINSIKNIANFAVLAIAITRVIAGLLTERGSEESGNIIRNKKDIHEDTNEDINIKRDEIKKTLEEIDDESIGDIGVEMKKAFKDLEE